MKKKENKVLVVVFVALIFVLFLMLLSGRVFRKQIAELTASSDILITDTMDIDWEQSYPFDTVIDEIKVAEDTRENTVSIPTIIKNRISRFGTLGNDWSPLIYRYSDIATLGYVIKSKLTGPSSEDNYIQLKNGYWVREKSSELSFDDAKNSFAPYASLNNYLAGQNIEFLYCCTPNKECAIDNERPFGTLSYTNQNIDMYIQALDYYGIDCLDLRQLLHDNELDHYSMFYKTDHHWKVSSGMWAASEIEKVVSNRYGLLINNASDGGSYKNATYPKAMFGSAGQSVSHFMEKSEDFDVLIPEFETKFRLEIPDKGIDVVGAFEDIFINSNGLEYYMNSGGGYAYEMILYGNRPYEKITNLNNPDAPKILMIRDSFSIAVAPYLAMSCSELVLIDTRSENGNFNGSIINCINKHKPDIVLVLQSAPQDIRLNE